MQSKKLNSLYLSFFFTLVLILSSTNVIAATKSKSTGNTSTSIKVQFYNGSLSSTDNTIYPNFRIYNNGKSTISLSSITVRYYYTIDIDKVQNFQSYRSSVDTKYVTGTFHKLNTPLDKADYYLEIGFNKKAGNLASGSYVDVQSRISMYDMSYYVQTNDYSFNNSSTSYIDWTKTTGYINGTLIWGTEPLPTAPTSTPTPIKTYIPTPTVVITPTAIPTYTYTAAPTLKPTLTPILTATPTLKPTASPILTPIPTPKPTAFPTPIVTPTQKPTATPILTPTPTQKPTTTPILTATPTPKPTVAPTSTSAPTKRILGFTTYYYSGDKSSYNSMVSNPGFIDEIATATHITDGYGNITGILPAEQISYANSNNITTTLLVGNSFSGDVAKMLLESQANRSNFKSNLVNILKNNNYKGVNIDIEGIYSSNRNHYTTFLSEIYSALKPLGYTMSVSVPAKTADNPNYTWNYAYDYAAISNYADYILLMTYDEHYPGGSAGPVASIGWVNNVVKYATTVIPKEKIYLGLAAYGYDWSGNETKAYSINGIYNLATSNGAVINWDNVSKSSYFSYIDSSGKNHTVWFENSMSIEYKLDLVNSYNLGGVGIWRLGLENSDYWNVIKSKIR